MNRFAISLFFCSQLMGLSQAMLLVSTPQLLTSTQLTIGELSMLITIGSALFLLSVPMWTKLCPLWGHRKVLFWAMLGYTASFGLMWFSVSEHVDSGSWVQSFLLVASRVVYGMFASAIVPTAQSWLIKLSPKKSKLMLSRLAASNAFGRLIGPLLAIVLLSIYQWGIFFFLVCWPIICTILIFFIPNDLPSKKITISQWTATRHHTRIGLTLSCVCAIYTIFCYLLTPLSITFLQLTAAQTSELLGVGMSAGSLSMVLAHLMLPKSSLTYYQSLKLAIMTIVLAILLLFNKTEGMLYASIILLSIGFATFQLSVTTYLCSANLNTEKSQATLFISRYQTYGYCLGAVSLWLIGSNIGIAIGLMLLLLVCSLMILLHNKFINEESTKNRSEDN